MGVGGAAAGVLAGSVASFNAAGSALADMSARTGVSVEALSELKYAAEQSGASADVLEGALRKMQKAIGGTDENAESAGKAFDKLGISAAQIKGLKPEEQFQLVADKLADIADPTERAAAALGIFGKSGTALLPMLSEGSAGLAAMRAKARELGVTMTSEDAAAADALGDSLDTLKAAGARAFQTIGAELAPAMSGLAGALAKIVAEVGPWLKSHRELVLTAIAAAGAATGLGVALYGAGTIISGTIATLSVAGAAVGALGGVLATAGTIMAGIVGTLVSPLGLLAAGAVGVVLAFDQVRLAIFGAFRSVQAATGALVADFTQGVADLMARTDQMVTGIGDALAAGDIQGAVDVLWAGIRLAWAKGMASIQGIVNAGREYLFGGLVDAWYGAQTAIEWAWHALQIAWVETVSSLTTAWQNNTAMLKQAWINVVAGMGDVWSQFNGWLTRRWLDLFNLLGTLTDEQVAAAKAMANEDMVLKIRKIEEDATKDSKAVETERVRRIVEIERAREDTRQKNDSAYKAKRAEISGKWVRAEQDIQDRNNADLAQRAADLEDARKALDESTAHAKAAREQAGVEAPGKPAAVDLSGIENAVQVAAAKVSIAGTFNASALFGMAGSSAFERTANGVERLVRTADRIEKKVDPSLG